MRTVLQPHQGVVEQVQTHQGVFHPQTSGLATHFLEVARAGIERGGILASHLDQHHIAPPGRQLNQQLFVADSQRRLPIQQQKHRRRLGIHHRLGDLANQTLVARPQQQMHHIDGQVVLGIGQRLVEQGLGVAHGPRGLTADQFQRLGFRPAPLADDDIGQQGFHHPQGNRRKIKPLAPRQDRGGKLLRIGGGKNEFDMGRRLLQRFQQGVECLVRQHVDFVDDVDLEPAVHRMIANGGTQLPDTVDATVAGTVYLQYIHLVTQGDGPTDIAGVARLGCGPFLAIETAGEDTGGGGFPHTTRPGKKVGVGDAARADGVAQGPGNSVLANQSSEILRAIAPRHHRITRQNHWLSRFGGGRRINVAGLGQLELASCGDLPDPPA